MAHDLQRPGLAGVLCLGGAGMQQWLLHLETIDLDCIGERLQQQRLFPGDLSLP
jgi:hypothetical protein